MEGNEVVYDLHEDRPHHQAHQHRLIQLQQERLAEQESTPALELAEQ